MDALISREKLLKAIEKAQIDNTYTAHKYGLPEVRHIIMTQEIIPFAEIAMERYWDLCSGRDADFIVDILHSRTEFKAWLERMEWHVKECNRLSDELRKTCPVGHWIVHQDWTGYYGECSVCHKTQRTGKTPLCPYCGAKMEGSDDITGKN